RRMHRDAHAAVLAQQHPDRARAARVARHGVIDAVEDPDQRGGVRRRFGQVQPAGQAVGVVAQVDLYLARLRVDRHGGLQTDALLDPPQRHGVVDVVAGAPSRRQGPDGGADALLAVVEPVLDVAVERVPADLFADLQQLALTHPGGSDHAEIVAVPVLRNADPRHAHADHVLHVAVVLLDLHAGEDQGTVVGSELPISAMWAFTSAVARRRPSPSMTGTTMQWSPAWELPWWGELWRKASPRRGCGWN